MSASVILYLVQDGLSNGAIYVLMGVGLVLVFTVTRVIFLSFGDLISYSALTLAFLQRGLLPGTVWLLVIAASIAFLMEAFRLLRAGKAAQIPRAALLLLGVPLIPAVIAFGLSGRDLPLFAEMLLTVALIAPLGGLLYRIVFQPIANRSVLVLLMAAVSLHFVLGGMALIFFGPEGYRTEDYVSGMISGTTISWMTVILVCVAGLVCFALFAYFRQTIGGKALLAVAHNRAGARIVGIRTDRASASAFTLAAVIAGVTGIVLGPVLTVYYDTAFLVGMKAFVGAVLGGFVSYPLAAVGALFVGLLESFVAFQSSAMKDIVVFFSVIPVLLARQLLLSKKNPYEEGGEA